jgi:hypothetical protein
MAGTSPAMTQKGSGQPIAARISATFRFPRTALRFAGEKIARHDFLEHGNPPERR